MTKTVLRSRPGRPGESRAPMPAARAAAGARPLFWDHKPVGVPIVLIIFRSREPALAPIDLAPAIEWQVAADRPAPPPNRAARWRRVRFARHSAGRPSAGPRNVRKCAPGARRIRRRRRQLAG